MSSTAAVEVRVAPLLYSYTGGVKDLKAEGATLGEVLREIDRRFPGIRFRLVDEQDRIRPHVRLFVNSDDAPSLEAPLRDGDKILIVGALSGG